MAGSHQKRRESHRRLSINSSKSHKSKRRESLGDGPRDALDEHQTVEGHGFSSKSQSARSSRVFEKFRSFLRERKAEKAEAQISEPDRRKYSRRTLQGRPRLSFSRGRTQKVKKKLLDLRLLEQVEDDIFGGINESRREKDLNEVGFHFETSNVARNHSKDIYDARKIEPVPDLPDHMQSHVTQISLTGIALESASDDFLRKLELETGHCVAVNKPELNTAAIGVYGDEDYVIVTEIFVF